MLAITPDGVINPDRQMHEHVAIINENIVLNHLFYDLVISSPVVQAVPQL